MNIQYISGFFDADGSISLCKQYKNSKYKALKIDFTNTDKKILIDIQNYLNNININSCLITKKVYKDNHSQSYCLSISNNHAVNLCKLLNSKHSKKRHRINCINKYYKSVTLRNGKYNNRQHKRKLAFERLFNWTLFS